MSLQKRSLSAAAETEEQALALLETEANLIYIDSGYFAPGKWAALCSRAHGAGKRIGLRFPHIFRSDAAAYLEKHLSELRGAGFDAWLLRSPETLFWMREAGILPGREELVSDHTMYVFNRNAAQLLREMMTGRGLAESGSGREEPARVTETLPLELNSRELRALCRADRPEQEGKEPGSCACFGHELVVYGRAPMMVSAQCVRKTARGCDRKPCVMQLRDRKGMLLPVKNNCTFCYNTVYNARPTVLYDCGEELSEIGADRLRYEFTVESGREVKEIVSGTRIFGENGFTRGHFHRGVE